MGLGDETLSTPSQARNTVEVREEHELHLTGWAEWDDLELGDPRPKTITLDR